jgi:rare lipoprotein A
VTNKDNGRSLVVRVNDRGPFVKSRIIDLSYAAAHQLGMAEKGTANVEIEAINFESTVAIKRNLIQKTMNVTKPRAVPTEPNKGRYIQVGAYSQHENAQKLARVLDREIQLPVTVSSILRAGQKLYRVRIGPILSLDIAEELAGVLNLKELGKPSIVYEN